MGLLERVNAAVAPRQRDAALGLDEWAQFFTFDGITYPMVQTSMSSIDEEQIAFTTSAAYKTNGPVFALVLARLQVFSQARFQWTRFIGGQPSDLFGSPELRVLERPWPQGTTGDLLARMEVDCSLAGNSYIRRTKADRLNRLRPDWVIVVLGSTEMADHPSQAADVEVVGHVYDPPSGPMQFFPIDGSHGRIAHYAPIPDPDFNFLGQSWITPVIREMQADTLSTEHKARFLTNAATPNMAIKFDPSVTLKQVKEFKELMEAEHQGAWNAYKTLYLGGGADAHVIGKDFRELDFAATQGKGESRLAAAAGVPPSWVGFSEGLQGSSLNAGNFTAARRRFADGTMQHLWTNAASSLEALLSPPDAGATLWFDTRSVAFMREDAGDLSRIQQEQAQTIAALVRDGFTAKSAVDALINNDWTRLVHTGLTSVQLQPPSDGQEPVAAENGPDNTPPKGVTP
ncbi:phage portal protein [Streptomyces sp. NPDC102394]|uniref:phage portal protein n=1 Tax=Streptomyces sp. NPDC102394 TaxID=3366167 RepID=UPI0038147D5A